MSRFRDLELQERRLGQKPDQETTVISKVHFMFLQHDAIVTPEVELATPGMFQTQKQRSNSASAHIRFGSREPDFLHALQMSTVHILRADDATLSHRFRSKLSIKSPREQYLFNHLERPVIVAKMLTGWRLSALFLFSDLAIASVLGTNLRDVCPSSPLWLLESHRYGLDEGDTSTKSSLGHGNSIHSSVLQWRRDCQTEANLFCAYSCPAFAQGRGVSIVSTDERMEIIQKLAAFRPTAASSGVNMRQPLPFEATELSGRGRGLVANKTLHKGDLILAHTPILVVDIDSCMNLDEMEWIEILKPAIT